MSVPGPGELLLILAIVIAIFGAGKLAGIGSALGSSIREFKKAVREDEGAAAPTTQTERSDNHVEEVVRT